MSPELGLSFMVVCSAYMTGIIWFVQLVQYPMFHLTDGANNSGAGHKEYTARMGIVVMPVMLAELGLQVWHFTVSTDAWVYMNAVLLAGIWLSTFFLQVPCHQSLTQGYDSQVHQRLVHSNWIRTVAWTSRTALLVWMLLDSPQPLQG